MTWKRKEKNRFQSQQFLFLFVFGWKSIMMFLSRCTKGISQENKKRKVEVCICYARRVTGTLHPREREMRKVFYFFLFFWVGGKRKCRDQRELEGEGEWEWRFVRSSVEDKKYTNRGYNREVHAVCEKLAGYYCTVIEINVGIYLSHLCVLRTYLFPQVLQQNIYPVKPAQATHPSAHHQSSLISRLRRLCRRPRSIKLDIDGPRGTHLFLFPQRDPLSSPGGKGAKRRAPCFEVPFQFGKGQRIYALPK